MTPWQTPDAHIQSIYDADTGRCAIPFHRLRLAQRRLSQYFD